MMMSGYKIAYWLKKVIHWYLTSYSGRLKISGRQKIKLCLIFMTSLLIFPAVADGKKEFAGNQQLLASCTTFNANPQHANAMPCIYYIKGFLAGAWNVDQVIANNLKEKNREPASWDERAYRHRVGKRGDRVKPPALTHFCSPDNQSETRIIEKLSKIAPAGIPSGEQLNAQIISALTVICPATEIN